MKKNLSLITLLYVYLFFPQTTICMFQRAGQVATKPGAGLTTTTVRQRISTRPESQTGVPRTASKISAPPRTIPLSQPVLPERFKTISEQQAQFEELEKKTTKIATVISKEEKEKSFFNKILEAHKKGKDLGFISNKALEDLKQLGPEYKELFTNKVNTIRDLHNQPIFQSQQIDSGYQFALPTTNQKATLYSIFGTKEKRNTDFLSNDFPGNQVSTKNLSTSLTLPTIEELFEPILENTTVKKAESKKQQQVELLQKAQELTENKARLERIVEELKTKELEEKQKLLSAQAAEQQAQQELEQATDIVETKETELEAAKQTQTELQTKTRELTVAEQQAIEKAHELAKMQAELEAQAESTRQAEIDAKEQLKKSQQAEQELTAKLKEAEEAAEQARLEKLRAQELKKQEEQKELDAFAQQIAKDLAQQELKQFKDEQQRIIEQEQAIEKNIQDLDAEIEILEKEQQQALQEQQLARTAQEQTIAQQKEYDAHAEQEQAQKDRSALENLKQASEQRLTELQQQHATHAEKKEFERAARLEQELKIIKQHIAATKYDIEQRQAQHLAELEVHYEQELHEASKKELYLSEQQKQERAHQKQTELVAKEQQNVIEEAELKKMQEDLLNLLQQQKDKLLAKIDYQLNTEKALQQQLEQTKEELQAADTIKTKAASEKELLQKHLHEETQVIKQKVDDIHNELNKTKKELHNTIQESEKIQFNVALVQPMEEENKQEEPLGLEPKKEEWPSSEEGIDEKKQHEILQTKELTAAPKHITQPTLFPTLPPIKTTEIPYTTSSIADVIRLEPTMPDTMQTKPSGTPQPQPSKQQSFQSTQPSFTPTYQGSQPMGRSTNWSRDARSRAKKDRNKKGDKWPYTPSGYDTRSQETRSSGTSLPSYPSYSESADYTQQTTEATPTQPITIPIKKIESAQQISPQVIEEELQESEKEEETTQTYKKRQFPTKEVIEEEPSKPTLHWFWRLLLWIKKQFMKFASFIRNVFKQ